MTSDSKKESNTSAVELKLAMIGLTYEDFIGLAQIAKVNILTEDKRLRSDFSTIEEEIVLFYDSLNKIERNRFLRRVRQIAKYNRIRKIE